MTEDTQGAIVIGVTIIVLMSLVVFCATRRGTTLGRHVRSTELCATTECHSR